jgi:hypothetical protein
VPRIKMLKSPLLFLMGLSIATASPQNFPVPKGDGTSGSGKYPAGYSVDPTHTGFTIYQPKAIPTDQKLPVIIWSNGMCYDQGLGFRNFLTEVASHGYFIVANGAPEGKGQSPDTKLQQSLEWVSKYGGQGNLAHVDNSKIAAAGQSCGGTQAYKVSIDKRVTLTGIFDSGNLFGNFNLKQLHAPVGYFLGGTSDMAYGPVSSNSF